MGVGKYIDDKAPTDPLQKFQKKKFKAKKIELNKLPYLHGKSPKKHYKQSELVT